MRRAELANTLQVWLISKRVIHRVYLHAVRCCLTEFQGLVVRGNLLAFLAITCPVLLILFRSIERLESRLGLLF